MMFNKFGRDIRTTNNNTNHSVIANKELGLEINAEKTKYMIMSLDQNAGQSSDIKGNKPFGTMEEFKYFGTTLTH